MDVSVFVLSVICAILFLRWRTVREFKLAALVLFYISLLLGLFFLYVETRRDTLSNASSALAERLAASFFRNGPDAGKTDLVRVILQSGQAVDLAFSYMLVAVLLCGAFSFFASLRVHQDDGKTVIPKFKDTGEH
jgi:hypothetical protein